MLPKKKVIIELYSESLVSLQDRCVSFRKTLQKYFIPLFLIYALGILTIIRADYPCWDDMGRILEGYRGWDNFGRYISEYLSILIHADTILNDISPLPQFLAVAIMAVASCVLLHVFGNPESKLCWNVAAVIPVGLSPFFLQCLSFKFDAPYMALSVLFSVLPLLFFAAPGFLYFSTVFLGALLMCTSYQASSGIFPISVIFLCYMRWLEGEASGKCLKNVLESLAVFALSCLFFKVFLAPSFEGYVSTATPSAKQLLPTILSNIYTYTAVISYCSPKTWVVMYLGIIASFLLAIVHYSARNGIQKLFLGTALIPLNFILSYGAFICLLRPAFFTRALYGFAIFITLCSLCALKLQSKNFLTIAANCCLSLVLLLFSYTYGNALHEQKNWEDARMETIVGDFSKIPSLDNYWNSNLIIYGELGMSPALKAVSKSYNMIDAFITCRLQYGLVFGEYYFRNYFALPLKNDDDSKKYLMLKEIISRSKVFCDRSFYTIYLNDEEIVLYLKKVEDE